MQNNAPNISRRKIIIFTLISLVLLLIVGEAICRMTAYIRFAPYQTNIGIQGDSRFANDPTMIWGNRPYYLEYARRYQYNEYGIKSEPGKIRMPEKKENDFWVFLFGGSAMAGKGSNRGQGYLHLTGVAEHNTPDTIEHHLQVLLQKSFPGKDVSVFNASVAMHTAAQSKSNYERLRHLKPDWVVSMDGFNEAIDEESVTIINSRRKSWPKNPINKPPIKQLRTIAKHSALAFLIGEYIYYKSGILEVPIETPPNQKLKRFWLNRSTETTPATPEKLTNVPSKIRIGFNEYVRDLSLFHNALELDKQKHLLLVQPFLIMRNIQKMPGIERAVYNLMQASLHEQSDHVHFGQYLFALFPESLLRSGSIHTMEKVHDWEGWVFVDYCHFSKRANKRIAHEISKFIASDGIYTPFPQL